MKKLDAILFSLSFLLLALLLANSNPSKVFSTLLTANLFFVLASLVTISIIISIKLFKWKTIMDSVGIKRPFGVLLGPYLASLFLSNITPGRVGEPSRSYYLKKATGDSFSLSISTVVLERIMDLSVMAAFSLIGAYFLSGSLPNIVTLAIFIAITIIVAALIISSNKKALAFFLRLFYNTFKFIPLIKRFERSIGHFLNNFHEGFALATREKNIIAPLIMTVLAWVFETGVIYFSFMAIGIQVPFHILLSVFSISTLIGLVTFLPGNIGSFEAASVLMLMQSQNLSLSDATSGIMLYRLCTLWFVLAFSSKFFLDQR